MPSYAHLVRGLTPPLVWDFGKRKLPGLVRALGGHYTHIRFEGDYPNFAAARSVSTGYDAPAILEKTRHALLKVKRGEIRWERDAMVSDSEEMPWALLAALLRIAALGRKGRLRVLDFGGSLGSTYFWCRPFLRPEIDLQWHVVEQPAHVRVGRADFADEELAFHTSIEEALETGPFDVLLVSGVLQFLEQPEVLLASINRWRFPHFLLDRTPLWSRQRHRLTVQHVPAEIYPASYPAWFLSRERVLALLGETYHLRWRAPGDEHWELDGEAVQNVLWQFEAKRPEGRAVP